MSLEIAILVVMLKVFLMASICVMHAIEKGKVASLKIQYHCFNVCISKKDSSDEKLFFLLF